MNSGDAGDPQQVPLTTPGARLEITALEMELGDRRLKLGSPCTLHVGNLYLVWGPSGSGKSSFVRALLGFGELTHPRIPCRGDVCLFDALGRSCRLWTQEVYHPESRDNIAFLPQAEKLGFIDGLSAFDNLRLFSHLPRAVAREKAAELAQRFHLDGVPENLARASGGERIRLSAVRGLMPRHGGAGAPALVVADEPTAGLDLQAARALADELIDLAASGESVVIVITHDPQLFVSSLPQISGADGHQDRSSAPESVPKAVRLLECTLGEQRGAESREIGMLQLIEMPSDKAFLKSARTRGVEFLQVLGGITLAPLAFVWGLLGLRRPRVFARQVAVDALGPGTQLFTLTGCLLVAGTVAYFIFEQTPRPELVEPLLLPEILAATGHTLVRVVLPLGACTLVATKLGAAQAARLASAVRSGLLESLALARWRLESYVLVPTVVAQILCMALATLLALWGGLLMAAVVYTAGHQHASLPLALDLMRAGLQKSPSWPGYLAAKVVASGFLAGTVAALFGHSPGTAEDDVANAVHRTLLWGVLCVIVCQCGIIIAEFAWAR